VSQIVSSYALFSANIQRKWTAVSMQCSQEKFH
jgi:hypothetical protein